AAAARFPVAFVSRLVNIGTGSPCANAARGGAMAGDEQYSVNPNGRLRGTVSDMPLTLADKAARDARPVYLTTKSGFDGLDLDAGQKAWARANGFSGQPGRLLVLPGADGAVAGAVFGVDEARDGFSALQAGA